MNDNAKHPQWMAGWEQGYTRKAQADDPPDRYYEDDDFAEGYRGGKRDWQEDSCRDEPHPAW
jgi:hypothetical protein